MLRGQKLLQSHARARTCADQIADPRHPPYGFYLQGPGARFSIDSMSSGDATVKAANSVEMKRKIDAKYIVLAFEDLGC